MKAYQIFQAISPELGQTLFQDLRDGHRDAYKGVLVSLAGKRRLRPVFLQRKPAAQQIAWLYKTCQLKPVDDVAENVLQVWLLRSQKDMLIRFLDELDISHDDDGTVDDLPESIDDKKLKKAVEGLLKEFPAERVALYLNVFQLQQAGGWDNLRQILETDSRLSLRAVTPPQPQEEAPTEDVPPASPKKPSSKKKSSSSETPQVSGEISSDSQDEASPASEADPAQALR